MLTGLFVRPVAEEIAFTVVVPLSENGAAYAVPLVWLGTVPSSVYRIVAPAVVLLSVTVCAEV